MASPPSWACKKEQYRARSCSTSTTLAAPTLCSSSLCSSSSAYSKFLANYASRISRRSFDRIRALPASGCSRRRTSSTLAIPQASYHGTHQMDRWSIVATLNSHLSHRDVQGPSRSRRLTPSVSRSRIWSASQIQRVPPPSTATYRL